MQNSYLQMSQQQSKSSFGSVLVDPKSFIGFPCMTGMPIVDCTGQYPGDDDPLDPACPPGYTFIDGECLRNI